MGWGMWFVPLLVIFGVSFLMRNYRQTKKKTNNKTLDELVKKQYALGEITRKQFVQLKEDIS